MTVNSELNDEQRQKILDLATDFPRLWNDPETPDRERKRMVRLLIEDVTISSKDNTTLTLGVRLRAGATRTLTIARELPAHLKYRTPETVVAEIDTLLEEHIDSEIADILNQRGHRSGHDLAFNAHSVLRIRRDYKLKSHLQRLRERGHLTLRETAETLGISPYTVIPFENLDDSASQRVGHHFRPLRNPPLQLVATPLSYRSDPINNRRVNCHLKFHKFNI